MTPPPGLQMPQGTVCRLRRALYDLKQAPRAWFERFSTVVQAASFTASIHDSAVCVHTFSRDRTILLLYVDDMILTGDNSAHIAFVKQKLSETLMTNLGPLRYFLSIAITSHPDGYRLSQQRYTLDLLARFGLTDTQTALHRWSFTCSFALLMGFPYLILLGIGIWLAVWSTLPLHV